MEQSPPTTAPVHSGAHPRCTSCGYELVGLRVEDRCPECGAPVWGSNTPKPTSGLAVTSLVLGIISGVCVLGFCLLWPFALLFGIPAVIFGEVAARQYRRDIRAGGTYGMSLAGRICGWIGIAVGLGFIALLVVGELANW